MSKRHTDREYEAELILLREQLLLMAGRVETMIGNAVRSLVEHDDGLARSTIDDDHKVNRLEVEIDELCLRVLARRQPVAGDLRFLTLALKMVTDLERIGDLAVDICERTLRLRGQQPMSVYDDISRMASLTQGMVRDAIDAFVNRDAAEASDVVERDAEVDQIYQQLCGRLLDIMLGDPQYVERGIHMLSVAKFVERIGDHGTNLAEQVIFMIKGKDIRHIGKLGGGSGTGSGGGTPGGAKQVG
jgi:phosphate transport system protein